MKTKPLHLVAIFILTANMVLSTFIKAQTISASRDSWSDYSLSICKNGTVMAWGDNSYGQLGNGTKTGSNAPIQVTGLSSVIKVVACSTSVVALKMDGNVWTWGNNYDGQLGNGTNADTTLPVKVSSLAGIIAIAGGSYHCLALKNDGTVWAWGQNYDGQLGVGTSASNIPLKVNTLTGIIAIAAGDNNSFALKNDGTVWAWGNNTNGQLGNGNNTASPVPVKVTSLTGITSISGTLAIKNDHTVWAWAGSTSSASNVPLQVNSLTGTIAIANGRGNSYALKNDSTVWAWGDNSKGQLGNGNNTSSTVPVKVSALTGITGISGGGSFTMATKNDGTVWVWGDNSFGQLGNGNTTAGNLPIKVSGLCTTIAPSDCFAHYTVTCDSIQNKFTLRVDSLTAYMAVSYHWDFGDGTTSTLATPSHTYTKDTLYNVSMEIFTASGNYCVYYHVIGKDASGKIVRTAGFTLDVKNSNVTTGISQNNSKKINFLVYPNPTNGNFTVNGDGATKVEIYNVLGEIIYVASDLKQQTSNEIDLSKSPKGIYFMNIYDGRKIYNQKIIIQ